MIAHYMPGLGNPMKDLDIGEFDEYLRRVAVVAKITSGCMSDKDILKVESGVY